MGPTKLATIQELPGSKLFGWPGFSLLAQAAGFSFLELTYHQGGMVCSWRRHASPTFSRHTNHLQQTCRNSNSSSCPAARVVWPPCEEGQWHYLDLISYLLLQACSTYSPSWGGLASPWRRSGHLAGSDQQQTGHINNMCIRLRRNKLYNLEDMCPLAFLNILDFDSLCYGI